MATPSTTLWKLEPHTLGKHMVLRSYLDAWLPVMSSWRRRLLFIDGFAGPGEYVDGEDGSPQIAMKALANHSAKIEAEVNFIFVEIKQDRAEHLAGVIEKLKSTLPSNSSIHVENDEFDKTMTNLLDGLDEDGKKLDPAFVMIDPFGPAGTPMSLVRRIMQQPQGEVYFSLMYESINRWHTELPQHLDELFGSPDWQKCAAIQDGESRRKCFYDLYEMQLRDAGAKHVVHFNLFAKNRLIYSIFFASKHEKGCDLIKSAIWKIAPEGGFEFRSGQEDQLAFSLLPDFSLLIDQLRQQFGDGQWHDIAEIEMFVRSDKTHFYSAQLRKGALIPLESDGEIEVNPNTRSRMNSYPKGCLLRFS